MTHLPRKRFGQHFLRDQAIIQQIVAALQPKQTDHLVEIGPGQGALTFPVMREAASLEAVELDRDLIPLLKQQAQALGQLTVYAADVLAFDFSSLRQDDRLLRVFGNLPYNISTPFIFHLLTYAPLIEDMLFMLQKEVAHRLAATVGEADYGRLSVMVQYHCEVEVLFDVPPRAFYPPPKVDSSIVRLVPYHAHYPCKANNAALFAELVKLAFGQRRKMLRNSLKDLIEDDQWATLPVAPTLRPEA